MIARYSRPEMNEIWTDRNRYLSWLKVECAASEEAHRAGVIPASDWKNLKRAIEKILKEKDLQPKDIEKEEERTRHDVIAFTTVVAKKVGPLSRYIHFGLTSSDVVDTALTLLIQDAGKILISDIQDLLRVLRNKALRYEKVATLGRTHGMFAEPTSFGLKFLGWYQEWARGLERLELALEDLRTGKLSGAVGVNAHWSPAQEESILQRLGLRREPVSTQVIPRDHHAFLMSVLAILGASLERVAVELRHLQRSEVAEVSEGFRKGQKGSSAMPHKRNPISSENLTGCARLMRSYAQAALENVALWHERDISHSSVERVIFPDAFILLDYAIDRMKRVITELEIHEDQIQENLNRAGPLVYSGHVLLKLCEKGALREDAYRWVQECAMKALETKKDFFSLAEKHAEIQKRLSSKELQKIANGTYALRNVREIYQRVFEAKKL